MGEGLRMAGCRKLGSESVLCVEAGLSSHLLCPFLHSPQPIHSILPTIYIQTFPFVIHRLSIVHAYELC